jgi:hypothetical protein
VRAIKIDPSDKNLRDEYNKLCDQKNVKEKEWYNKMSGFYESKKLTKIE